MHWSAAGRGRWRLSRGPMLLLNTIFEAEGLDPNRVQLVRHKDARLRGRSLFDVWYSEREKFEAYQSIQRPRNPFDEGGLVASFLFTGPEETLFLLVFST